MKRSTGSWNLWQWLWRFRPCLFWRDKWQGKRWRIHLCQFSALSASAVALAFSRRWLRRRDDQVRGTWPPSFSLWASRSWFSHHTWSTRAFPRKSRSLNALASLTITSGVSGDSLWPSSFSSAYCHPSVHYRSAMHYSTLRLEWVTSALALSLHQLSFTLCSTYRLFSQNWAVFQEL